MENQNYKPEILIANDFKNIELEKLETIVKQNKSICKIYCEEGGNGTGFFALIPFPDQNNLLPVLMTNNHVLKENNIIENKNIEFTYNNDKHKKTIVINKY